MKNLEIKKDILNIIKFADEYKIHLRVWCEYAYDNWNTWGEIVLEIDGKFAEFYSIDTIDYDKSLDDLTTDEVETIKKELKKRYDYLNKHFENVVLGEGFQWI